MRAIPFVIITLMLGGCMQETPAPVPKWAGAFATGN
jgi:hypothetical protein